MQERRRRLHSDPAGLIIRQQLCRCSALWIIRIINVRELLTVSIAYNVVVRLEFGRPGCGETAGGALAH